MTEYDIPRDIETLVEFRVGDSIRIGCTMSCLWTTAWTERSHGLAIARARKHLFRVHQAVEPKPGILRGATYYESQEETAARKAAYYESHKEELAAYAAEYR